MFGVLLSILMIAALVDPFTSPPGDPFAPAPIDERLEAPLQLLAEVRDRDDQPIGEQYASLVPALHLTLAVAELRPGLAGKYTIPTRTVTISAASLREDPRFVAAALAHEIKHADDADFVGLGLLEPDCLNIGPGASRSRRRSHGRSGRTACRRARSLSASLRCW